MKYNEILTHHLTNIGVFLSWTVTSFSCHKCAEISLHLSRDTHYAVLLLTSAQIFACFFSLRLRRRGAHNPYLDQCKTFVACSHVIATLSTNYSLSLIPASSTFAIKMLEPITSAVVVCAVKSQRPPLSTTISIVIIIIGAFIFTGNPLQDGVLLKGVFITFVSNLALAARNTGFKTIFKNSHELSPQTPGPILTALILLPGMMFLLSDIQGQDDVSQTTFYITMSSLFHVLYSYMSIALVLKSVTVVTHAVLNIFKRVVVVILLCVFGHRSVTTFNIFGLVMAAAGLEVYSESTRVKRKGILASESRSRISRYGRQVPFYVVAGITCFAIIQINISTTKLLVTAGEDMKATSSYIHGEEPAKHFGNVKDGKAFSINHAHINDPQRTSIISHTTKKGTVEPLAQPAIRLVNNKDGERSSLSGSLASKENIPSNTHILNMTTFDDIITESQRVQRDILMHVIGSYKYIVLTDIAVHENKGDAAITAGEILMLRRLKKDVIFYCNTYACSDRNLVAGKKKAVEHGVKNVAVLCHGGGNLVGYKEHDEIRGRVFEIFNEFNIIVLPQSIWLKPGTHLKEVEYMYRKHSNVTLFLRDMFSMELARKHFPSNKRFLVPDSAFQIGHVPKYMRPSYDILWLRRTDVERVNYKLPAFPPNISAVVGDWRTWVTAKGPTTIENAFLIAHNGFTFLQRGRVVITDRLHGHIMCVLLHIPHVLLDTSDHKLSKYHRTWTRGLAGDTVLSAESPVDAMNKALQLLEKFRDTLASIDPLMTLQENLN